MKNHFMTMLILLAIAATTDVVLAEDSSDNFSDTASIEERWAGRFWGLNAGFAQGYYDQRTPGTKWGADDKLRGFSGGASIGFNRVVNSIVIGIEADIQKTNIGGEMKTIANWTCIGSENCQNEIDWYGTLRARIGKPIGAVLPFLTGGLAIAKINTWDDKSGVTYTNYSANKRGWVFGAGVETILNDNASLKFEVLHLDFGTLKAPLSPSGEKYETENKFTTARIGINWKF